MGWWVKSKDLNTSKVQNDCKVYGVRLVIARSGRVEKVVASQRSDHDRICAVFTNQWAAKAEKQHEEK